MIWHYLILASALLKTIQDFIFKKLLKKEYSSEALLNNYIFMLPIFLFFISYIDFEISSKIYILIAIRSLFVVSGGIMFSIALKNSDLSIVAPFYNLSPVFVIIISGVLLGEKLSLIEYLGIALMIVGSLLLKNEEVSIKDHHKFIKSKYFIYVLGCLIMWAFSATIAKPIVEHTNPINALFISMVMSVAFLILYQTIRYNDILNTIKDLKKDWKIASLTSIAAFFYSILYFMALSYPDAKVSIIVPLFRFYVFLEVIIGGKILKEKNLFKKVYASAIMLIGMVVIVT